MKKRMKYMNLLFIWCLYFLFPVQAADYLIPGGQLLGLELQDSTITIAAFHDTLGQAAREAGLQPGDRLISIDGQAIRSVQDVRQALRCSSGTIVLQTLRKGKQETIKIRPVITDQGPKLGLYLKDAVSGVGTLTWYDPQSRKFGALGHGVSGREGSLIPLEDGWAYDAKLLSIQKGLPGKPGQLMGAMGSKIPLGKLEKNCPQGVFGSAVNGWPGSTIPVGTTVKPGSAVIRCTLDGTAPRDYTIRIIKVYDDAGAEGRNMLLEATDPALLQKTGGIVQGMSGSPIIQDGKLVGAVTHVLVGDPTQGYGIFIGNMLDAAA